MKRAVVSLDIERFRRSLATETDRDKRRQIIDCLAQERERLRAIAPSAGATPDDKYCAACGGPLQLLSQVARFCAPHSRVLTTYFGCVRCVQIQIEDRVTPANEHLDDILRLAMAEVGAFKGHIQLLDRRSQTLFIVAHRECDQDMLDRFKVVSAGDGSITGRALREQKRITIENMESSGLDRRIVQFACDRGVKAYQSTPLLSRDNTIDGMISTHFDAVHRPSAGDLMRMGRHLKRAFELID